MLVELDDVFGRDPQLQMAGASRLPPAGSGNGANRGDCRDGRAGRVYSWSMSALSSDAHGPARVTVRLPRTIRAVRAALPDEQSRAAFAAELEDGDVAAVFEAWWCRAVIASSPRTVAALAELDAGTLETVPATAVFGDRWAG